MKCVIKNVLRVTIVSKEIECADRIVSELEIYSYSYTVVVSARAKECLSI